MRTQLYEWHKAHGELINFSGFEMPVRYSTIAEEHLAVRIAVGLFDVSHMGRMWIKGSHSSQFLNYLVPRDLAKVAIGRHAYSYFLNERAGFRDDIVLGHYAEDLWLLVWNAGNREKIKHWLYTFKTFAGKMMGQELDIQFDDVSNSTAMFALQGPKAAPLLKDLGFEKLPSSWGAVRSKYEDISLIISRTGYTGEDGFEIIVEEATTQHPENALKIWETLLEHGSSYDIKPCGLGARDTLRLEAGYPLYGNDIEENITPLEADLLFPPFAHMEKEWFVGKYVLIEKQKTDNYPRRVGLRAFRRGPAIRHGTPLLDPKTKKQIGIATSGTYSPLLKYVIGMGYVPKNYTAEGTKVLYQVKNRTFEAEVTKFPFYDENQYGKKRKK